MELTGDLGRDVSLFLIRRGCPKTAEHCRRVAAECARIAALVGADVTQAESAGWLHDVSAVFPHEQRTEVARGLGLEVLPEEDAFPMIAHQKLSAVLAREFFGVDDPVVTTAVGCHTTLQVDAGMLDKVLFVADKIKWDGVGLPPYHKELLHALEHSLDEAARCYLHWLWERRESLRVVHPWLVAAHRQMCNCP